MRKALLSLAAAVPLLAPACKTVTLQIPEADQVRAERELSGQQRFLRVAAYVGPLWRDTDKLLVTDQPAGEIDIVEEPNGKPIFPPKPERILPPARR